MNNDKSTKSTMKIVDMIQESKYMKIFYEKFLKPFSNHVSSYRLFDNKDHVKYILRGLSAIIAIVSISTLSYFMISLMFAYAYLKCIVWLIDEYTPEKKLSKSDEVLEYMVVPITIFLISYPLQIIYVPFFGMIIREMTMMLGLTCITNHNYRQRFCIFIRDRLTSRQNNTSGVFVKECGELYKFLQTIIHCIDCVCTSTFNITHNPGYMIEKICNSVDLPDIIVSLSTPVTLDEIVQRDIKIQIQQLNTKNLDELDEHSLDLNNDQLRLSDVFDE
jgi:hypothetical protein